MIVDNNFTYNLLLEIRNDYDELKNTSLNRSAKANRIVKKSKTFPISVFTPCMTKRKNKWLIHYKAYNKKEVNGKLLINFICIRETEHGKICYVPYFKDKLFCVKVFYAHFFSRYSQRANINLTGEELIRYYFAYNENCVFYYNTVRNPHILNYDMYGTTTDGVALGILHDTKRFIIIKTFITFDMLKDLQLDTIICMEKIRRKIMGKDI